MALGLILPNREQTPSHISRQVDQPQVLQRSCVCTWRDPTWSCRASWKISVCVWKIRRMHLMGTEKTDSKLFIKGGHLDSVFWSLNVFVEGRRDHIWIYLICKLHFLKHRIKSPTADTTEKFSSVIQLSRDLTTAPCQLFLKTLSFLQLLQRETHPKKVKFHTRLKVNIYVDILCLQMSLAEHQL